jgi:hypothetical protein
MHGVIASRSVGSRPMSSQRRPHARLLTMDQPGCRRRKRFWPECERSCSGNLRIGDEVNGRPCTKAWVAGGSFQEEEEFGGRGLQGASRRIQLRSRLPSVRGALTLAIQ